MQGKLDVGGNGEAEQEHLSARTALLHIGPQSDLRGGERQFAFSATVFSLVAYPFHSPPCLQGDYLMTGRILAPFRPSPTQGTPPSSVQWVFGEALQPRSAASYAWPFPATAGSTMSYQSNLEWKGSCLKAKSILVLCLGCN